MPIPLAAGAVLRDRYVVRHIIGRGGMGSIYLAEDNRLPGRMCALKEVHLEPDIPEVALEQGREQFYSEAKVLARLDHPNLPKVSDYFSEGDRDYLVMDFVPGEDLKTMMDRERREGRFLHQGDVLGHAVIVITGDIPGGACKHGMGPVDVGIPHAFAAPVFVPAALDLIGRGGRAPEAAIGKRLGGNLRSSLQERPCS